ncbi:MAG: hypothetical protein ACI4TU_02095 [Candidatus Cryptobacteroides sp.]
MKDRTDILSSHEELKKMPYEVPEGYFESFKASAARPQRKKTDIWHKVYPMATMAAMLVVMVTAGTFFLKKATPAQEMSLEDYIICSGMDITTTSYQTYSSATADAQLSNEDIVSYLIYTGMSAENIHDMIE